MHGADTARRLEKYGGAVMTKKKDGDGTVQVEMFSGNSKFVGGGEQEAWILRIMRQVLNALPLDQKENADIRNVAAAVFSGVVDLKSADPIEGMLVSQLVVAHEAALRMYQRARIQDNFDIKARYLALADKVSCVIHRDDLHLFGLPSGRQKPAPSPAMSDAFNAAIRRLRRPNVPPWTRVRPRTGRPSFPSLRDDGP
jgi:hypothetical protein